MNYTRPELIEALAAEFVLGTLRGRARTRMATLLRDSQAMRNAVWRWENRFAEIGLALPPVEPSAHNWNAIEQRIQPNVVSLAAKKISSTQKKKFSAKNFWQGWSAIATAAALVLAILLVSSAPRPSADHVAVFANAGAQPQWLVSIDLHSGKLHARALNVAAANADKAFELWMLPEGGAAPRSLGLLPVANHAVHTQLPNALSQSLRTAAGLAISLEPAGGSPTGLPTGPVLYQAPLLQL